MKKLYISLSALLATGFAAQAQDGMGIGNSNPQEMLDVTGAIKIGGTIVGAADAGSIRWNGTNFQGYDGSQWVNLDESGGTDADWTVSGNNQYSAVSGNVGIGTGSPTSKLEVAGQVKITGGTPGAGKVLTSDANGLASWQTPSAGDNIADSDNDTKIQVEETGDEDKIRFDTGNVERMIIDNSGNVGIGDNSPSNRLHVSVNSGSGLSVPVLVQNTGAVNAGGTGSGIGFSNMGNIDNAKAILYNERTADYGIGKLHVLMNNSNNTAAATLADARMTILSDGNVGIGTTSPTSELEVSGQLKVSGSSPAARLLLTGYSTTEGGELQLNGGSNYTSSAYALDNYEGRLRILRTTNANGSGGSGTTEVISVKGTNQVGIGNIGGNAWPAESNLIIGDNGGLEGGQIQFYNANGAGTSWFLDVYGNEFRFLTGNNITGSGSPKSIITNTGNLIMAGSVRASNGQYLFEDGCSNYLKLQADGNAVIYYGNNGFSGWASGTNCSDMRLKENIRDLESVLSVIQDLDVIRYNYKEETGLPSGPQVGVNAQQLFKYFPEMVYYNEEKDQYVVYYDKLTTLLIKGMQEMIENLKTSNASLSDSYMSLKTELSEMKDWIQYKSQTSNE